MNPVKPLDWLRAAIDDDRLTTTQRAAVAGIARRAPGKSQPGRFAGQVSGWDFYLSRNELAGMMAASVATAERCTTRLHELGLLEKVSQGGRRGRGETAKKAANVWRLALPSNPSPVMTWSDFQPLTGDELEEGSNPSETHLPTPQEGVFQPLTGDTPREHRYQGSAVLQESSANAIPLARNLVHEDDTTTAQNQTPTQARKVTTDRESSVLWPTAGNTSEAWV
ncbi:MAG TPA: hypothetical protein VGK17_03140 [Propionicimonas sp.]|jgi:hypothetical protein